MTVRVEAPLGLFEDDVHEKDWFFSVYRKLVEDLKTKTFTSFTPSITGSGSMSISGSTITFARYAAIGELIFLDIAASFTVGGTPDLSINLDMPLTASSSSMIPCVIKDGGNELSGFCILTSGSKTIDIRRYDGSNWNAGSGREIRISGHYRSTEVY